MTVRELIEALQKADPDSPVMTEDDCEYYDANEPQLVDVHRTSRKCGPCYGDKCWRCENEKYYGAKSTAVLV